MNRAKTAALGFLVVVFIVSGILHFAATDTFARIIPPYIPQPRLMVQVSGVAEILGALGLIFSRTRKAASLMLVTLCIAVFPANVYMATNPIETGTANIPTFLRWARLPLHPLLIWWILWCTRRKCTALHVASPT